MKTNVFPSGNDVDDNDEKDDHHDDCDRNGDSHFAIPWSLI